MSEMIRIRSIREYAEEFGNNGIGKGVKASLVKQQILDAFRKEIFDQITWKLKVTDISEIEDTEENNKTINNIMKNAYKKWLGVVRVFNRYRETYGLLKPGDLTILKEQNEMYDPLDGFDDEGEENVDKDGDNPEETDGGMAEDSDGEGHDSDESSVSAGSNDG